MCDICEGASDDELLFGIHGRILNFGWAIEYVWSGNPQDSWGYTIGLTQRCGHPELALAGRCAEHTGPVINALGHEIKEGLVLSDGSSVTLEDVDYRLVEAHPAQLDAGTFTMWDFYYRGLGWRPPEHRVLEIVGPGELPHFDVAPPRSS